MKMKVNPVLALVIGVGLAIGGFAVVQHAQASDSPAASSIEVQLSVVDDDRTIDTWTVGYRPARPFEAMTVGLQPLSYSGSQRTYNGVPFLDATMEATITGQHLTSDITVTGWMIADGATVGLYDETPKTTKLGAEGGKAKFDFPSVVGGTQFCGKKVTLLAIAQGDAKGNAGQAVHGEDSAKFDVAATCQASQIGVTLTAYPFSHEMRNGNEVSFTDMVPVSIR